MNRLEKLGLLALFIMMVILIGIFAFLNNRQQPPRLPVMRIWAAGFIHALSRLKPNKELLEALGILKVLFRPMNQKHGSIATASA